jgi:hypothetical protein
MMNAPTHTCGGNTKNVTKTEQEAKESGAEAPAAVHESQRKSGCKQQDGGRWF